MAEIQKGKRKHPANTYRVLVLDGNDDHMPLIVAACKNAAQEVVPCKKITEAFAFLNTENHVDVIVAEAFMEHESIFDFLKTAKESPSYKDVPVMVIACEPGLIAKFCMPSVAHAAEILGVNKFLVMKQFDAVQLVREIQAILPELPKKQWTDA